MQPSISRFLIRHVTLAVTAAILLAFTTVVAARPAPSPAASREFFTDEEIDYLRDAQGLAQRVPAILRLANIRLVSLYMKEKSKEDKELERRISEIHDELSGKPQSKSQLRRRNRERNPGNRRPITDVRIWTTSRERSFSADILRLLTKSRHH